MNSYCKEFFSCLFLRQSHNKRYERLKEQHNNAFIVVDNKYTGKILEAKTLLEYYQGPSISQPVPITNKEEEGGAAFAKQGKTAVVKKDPKENFHG